MKILKFWFPVLVYSAIIFGVSSIPNLKTPQSDLPLDKLAHVLLYLPFGYLLARALDNIKMPLSKKFVILMAVFGSFVYGLGDEYHQTFVAGRSATLGDVAADVLGGWLGSFLYKDETH